MRRLIPIAVSLLLFAAAARADDFKLKDGSQISGTIVGFDNSSFKVQTSYGFALVLKSQVASITISDGTKVASEKPQAGVEEESTSKVERPAAISSVNSAAAPVSVTTQTDSSKQPKKIIVSAPPAVPTPRPASAAVSATPPAIPAKAAASSSALASVAAPSAPPRPGPIREEVDGSTYVNETYGFRMYKPPDWEVIPSARSMMPGAITAMGTNDEDTYLLIGEAPAGKSLASDIDATDQRLRGLLDNFRPLSESHVTVSGTQAIERRFRGSVDQKDWSGTVVFFSRGGELYTIFGMTLAQTDLVQIQENVIARAISSLQFVQ
jgi:hypothetical protein